MSDNNNNKKEYLEEKTQNNNIITCEICGSKYHKINKIRHERTKKHAQAKYVWLERFEIER